MIFENYIKENKAAFISKVEEISAALHINPDWLMAVMAFESNINHLAVNSFTGATGLIQFMPKTAISLGTTTGQLQNMSNVEQLEYVYKYLKPYAGKMKRAVDVYLAVFFPAAINKSEEWVLCTSTLPASIIAIQNPVFDVNKNGEITVAGVQTTFLNWIKKKGMILPVS